MEFSSSILPPFGAWQLTDSVMAGNKLYIAAGGTAYCVVYPSDSEEAVQKSEYQVTVNQMGTSCDLMVTYDAYYNASQDYTRGSIVMFGSNIKQVISTNQRSTRRIVFTIENKSNSMAIISSALLKPVKAVSSATELELSKYETHIVKYTNLQEAIAGPEKTLIAHLNIETSEKTDLLLHLLLNGTVTEDATLALNIEVNGNATEYSPLEVDISKGKFLVGIPANLMGVASGENRVKVYSMLTSGSTTYPTRKIQFTLDGQSMVAIYGEDIWFGPSEENDYDPCTHEVFIHEDSNITYIAGGQLNVNTFSQGAVAMTQTQTLKKGIVYEYTFGVNKAKSYEEVTVT